MEEELLNGAEIRELFNVVTAKLPTDRHDDVRLVLQPV